MNEEKEKNKAHPLIEIVPDGAGETEPEFGETADAAAHPDHEERSLRSANASRTSEEGQRSGKCAAKSTLLSEILSWLQVIAAAVVIAFLLNNFIIANSQVPTGSMVPTINEGNRVIGLRLSYTFGDPERGDIAIFKFGWICRSCSAMGESPAPEVCPRCGKSLSHPRTLYYVKRVIGVPGDVIEIRPEGSVKAGELSEISVSVDAPDDDAELVTAAVYVNGEKLDEPYLNEPMLYTSQTETHFEVPEGCYFLLGDNRNNSADARYWNNPYISDDKMIAKVLFRYFPNPSLLK